MKHFFPLLTGLFSFILIDLKRFRARRATLSFCAQGQVLEEELNEARSLSKKNKRNKRGYKNSKYKKRPVYRPKHAYKFRSARPKDRRHSNQRSLRRMYRNM